MELTNKEISILDFHKINPNQNKRGLMRDIINKAVEYQHSMWDTNKNIVNNILSELNDDIKIDPPVWRNFIDLAYRIAEGKDVEKKCERILEKARETTYQNEMAISFINDYIIEPKDNIEFPSFEDVDVVETTDSSVTSSIFIDKLKEAVNKSSEGMSYRSMITELCKVGAFILSEDDVEIKTADIRKVVNHHATRLGNYPKEDAKPKLVTLMKNFSHLRKMYEYCGLADEFEMVTKGFGIEVKTVPENRNDSYWQDIAYFLD